MTTSLAWANREQRCCLVLLGSERLFLASRIQRYFQWLGIHVQLFSQFQTRLEMLHESESQGDSTLQAIFEWLKALHAHLAIVDARDATEQSCLLLDSLLNKQGVRTVFIESICTDSKIIETILELHKGMVDFEPGQDKAVISDDRLQYLQVYNLGRKIISNRCGGFFSTRITTILSHMHVAPRYIWITRHGESEDNTRGRLGGDSPLSEAGRQYAEKLAAFILQYEKGKNDLVVLTSTLQRTVQTAEILFKHKPDYRRDHVCTPRLNEIGTGLCDGMTYAEVKEKYPDVYKARKKNKYQFRYPMGESYADVIERVAPVMMELERLTSNVLLICHQALLRTVMAYFLEIPHSKMVNYPVPLHCVLKLTPGARGVHMERFQLGTIPPEKMSMHGDEESSPPQPKL
eukprot:g72613.t1